MTEQELLQAKYARLYEQLRQKKSDIGEQIKSRYTLGGEMEGGFGAGETARMGQEFTQTETDLRQRQGLESQHLKEIKDREEATAKRQRRASMWKSATTVLGAGIGAALAAPTGGMSVLLGAGLGAGAGSIVGETGAAFADPGYIPQYDFGFLADWDEYRERRKANGTV